MSKSLAVASTPKLLNLKRYFQRNFILLLRMADLQLVPIRIQQVKSFLDVFQAYAAAAEKALQGQSQIEQQIKDAESKIGRLRTELER